MDIKTLKQKKADLLKANETLNAAAADRMMTKEELATFEANMTEIEGVTAQIDAHNRMLNINRTSPREEAASEVPSSSVEVLDKPKFKSLGEQLTAVAVTAKTNGMTRDPRLRAAALGVNEAVPSEGGFLVEQDFAKDLLMRTYETGRILALTPRLTISSTANRTRIPAIDETSRADGSRYGGIQSFWANEADTITATKPKFRGIDLILNKLTALCYATDEMLQDAAVLESTINRIFPLEMGFRVEDAIINGVGAGMPLGILNAPAKVTVNKESGQTTGTVQTANVLKMWSRMWNGCRVSDSCVWLISQDIEPQLYTMTVGTGGGTTAVIYLPPGGISGKPYGTLLGKPVIPVEYTAALSTEGDIILADFAQYMIAEKGIMEAAQSMHVQFLTDQMTYRFIQRLDGQPLWNSALTPKNGGPTQSSIVTLQSR